MSFVLLVIVFSILLRFTASLVFFGVVLSVLLRLTASHYPFDIFKLLTTVLSVLPRFTVSDYPFGIFKHLAIIICPSINGFWFLLWFLQTFGNCVVCPSSNYVSDYPLVFSNIGSLHFLSFDLRIRITPLITSNCTCILCSSTIIYIPPPLYWGRVSCARETRSYVCTAGN